MTSKRVVPRALANRDVRAAIDHYLKEVSAQVALGFIDALQRGYDHVGRHPTSGSSRLSYELNLPGLRTWPLQRYPYVIFYVEREDCIDVWRVLHGQRDLPAWLQHRYS